MIEINDLSVSYGKGLPDVIRHVSFKVDKGTILNVLGQNAVGKTTLIRALMRELRGYRGSIKVAGNEVTSYSVQDYAKLVGVVSTSFNTYQNLLVADYLVTGFINQMAPFSKPSNENVQRAYEVLAGFGKQELFNKQIDQLSSGERQIVMIARVLLQDPDVIIVDEPTANLDIKNQINVLNQIKRLADKGYTVVVTSHNPGHARSMGGKTLIMGAGKYTVGDTGEVLTEAILAEYYGLDVAMRHIDDFECMVFEMSDEDESVSLVF